MSLLFRHYEPSDAAILLSTADDPDVRLHTATIPVNPTLQWAQDRIENSVTGERELFGLFDDDTLVAEAGWFLNTDKQLEIGYMVAKESRGLGYGRRAISELIRHLRQGRHYKDAIYAKVTKDNRTSINILEKAGFIRIGEGSFFSKGRNETVANWLYKIDKID